MQFLKRIVSFISILSLFIAISSCAVQPANNDDDDKTSYLLNGYWKSTYGDGFEISTTAFKQYDDASKAVSFSGEIAKFVKETDTTGRIVVKISDAGTWKKTVGEYIVVRYKNYSSAGVAESTPYLSGKDCDGLPTIEAAEAEYTDANGYFAFYGDYLKQ